MTKRGRFNLEEITEKYTPYILKALKAKIPDFCMAEWQDAKGDILVNLITALKDSGFRAAYGDASVKALVRTLIRRQCSAMIFNRVEERSRRKYEVVDPVWGKHECWTRAAYSDDDVAHDNWLENKMPVPFLCPEQTLKFWQAWVGDYPDRRLERKEAALAIRGLRHELILRMRLDGDGARRKEIAAELGLTEGQVKGRLELGRKEARKRLSPLGYKV